MVAEYLEQIRRKIRSEVGGIDGAVDLLVSRFKEFLAGRSDDWRAKATSPSGVVLSGIPGSGKSKLALAFARAAGLDYEVVNCPELFFADQGKSEACLIEHFTRNADDSKLPQRIGDKGLLDSVRVLILEDIDVLAGSKKPDTIEARMFSLLLSCIDSSSDVFVIGATNRISAIPEEIRRLGRLDTVVDVHLADAESRAAVLQIMLQKFENIAHSEDIHRVAKAAHGFSAADLQSLCLRGFMDHGSDTSADDLVRIASEIKPSNLSSFQSNVPVVHFSDIFGLEKTIQHVKALVIEPLLHAEKYHEMQVEPPRGALIYGPPGSGKSMLCCAVANELAVNTIWVDSTQMRSMIVGESEKAIADLFEQARKSAPCILLFDHVSKANGHGQFSPQVCAGIDYRSKMAVFV
ncbi:hypothetical protein GGI07_001379 [Coemansia sp. Benny D115]|nr:hypothetical protein GGI07_001379 [Coemansia sp. Benny D115]